MASNQHWISHSIRNLGLTASSVVLVVAATPSQTRRTQVAAKPKASPSFETSVRPLLVKHCLPCHSGENPRAGLSLEKFRTAASVTQASNLWEKVADNVASGHMPPPPLDGPTKAQRKEMVAWIQTTLAGNCGPANPGRVTMRRLNRNEYDNTVRDLTGLDLHLSDAFPSDDVGYGFDNIGDVLSISPLLMEKYLSAAETVAKKLIVLPQEQKSRYVADHLHQEGSDLLNEDLGRMLPSNGRIYVDHDFLGGGRYKIVLSASADQAGNEPVRVAVRYDDRIITEANIPNPANRPKEYTFEVDATSGRHRISVEFLNDYYRPGPPPQDRNLYVQAIQVNTPPLAYDSLPELHRRVIFLRPTSENRKAVIRQCLSKFATRAYRRPVLPAELDRLEQLVTLTMKDGESFERGMLLGVQAILSSPYFLFRVERESADGTLNSYELASRLSYFLWSSMPDERLESLAATNALKKPTILAQEALRMLKDPRSKALGENFGAQWLNLRKLNTVQPDPELFPNFNDRIRGAMMTETRMFFDGVVREDRNVVDFLNAKYTYLNGELARYYGLKDVEGDEFRKVSLVGVPRSGILTQGSILTLTSNPTRTSPVKRGKWVLDQLLNQPPPPPPPNVPSLGDDRKVTGATLRLRMEAHRKDPACATCHQRMDPIGFSLENFDGAGRWRTREGAAAIDASGVLPDGTKFEGPDELRSVLVKRSPEFVRCLSEKLLTYALGRGVEPSDRCYVDDITAKSSTKGNRFSSLVSAIVESEPFRKRRPVPAPTRKGTAK